MAWKLWIQLERETHVTLRKGNLTMIFASKSLGNNVQEYQEESGQMDGMQGNISNSNPGK